MTVYSRLYLFSTQFVSFVSGTSWKGCHAEVLKEWKVCVGVCVYVRVSKYKGHHTIHSLGFKVFPGDAGLIL